MNHENLETLANYLEALPAGYRHFSMWTYLSHYGRHDYFHPVDAGVSEMECGTVACAVGHGPAAGLAALPGENWEAYEQRVFGVTLAEWTWCFASSWGAIDNTPQGAAKRIRYMLELGVPWDARDQLNGEAPYLFAKEEEA